MRINRNRLRVWGGVWILGIAAILAVITPANVSAASANAGGDFSVQVSPSPLVVTLKPGATHTATLTVRNLSNHSETLVPHLNAFTMGESGKIDLQTTPPPELSNWISFGQPSLTVPAGGSQQLNVIYKTPGTVGFSYSLAITLNRSDETTVQSGARYKASVAVFNLINIDRSDAKRQLAIDSFTVGRSRYEFLPASFDIKVKNTGNVIVQPSGNIFVQRSFDSNSPLATLAVNQSNGYILPDTTRTLSNSWDKGFPAYRTTTTDDGKTEQHLSWDWKHLGDLRFGKYVAKVVLVYNDGQRDVPLVASVSFWVIPWRIILVTAVLLIMIVTGIVGWGKIIAKGTGKIRKKYAAHKH